MDKVAREEKRFKSYDPEGTGQYIEGRMFDDGVIVVTGEGNSSTEKK